MEILAKWTMAIGVTGIIGCILLWIGKALFNILFKKISASPPYVALTTLWGKRKWRRGEKVKIKMEGWRFFADFFPFFYTFIPVKVEKLNIDYVFENIRCRAKEGEEEASGGEVRAHISLTVQPDYISNNGSRLVSYIDSGPVEESYTERVGEDKKPTGFVNILREVIEEDVRQMGKLHDWEAFTFSSDNLSKKLIQKLTGEDPQQKGLSEIHQEMNQNGKPDVRSLGIRIWRFNIGEIKEQGELAKWAESLANEQQQRRAETYEVDTELIQAMQLHKAYQEIGENKTLENCILEIRRRKVIREGHGKVWDISGIDLGQLFKKQGG